MGWCCGLAFGPKGTPHWYTDDVGKFMSILRLFLLVLVLAHQGYLGFQVAVAEVRNGKPFRSSVVPHVCQDPISARKLRNIAWYWHWCSHSPTLRISSWCPVIGPGVSEWKSFKGGRLTSIRPSIVSQLQLPGLDFHRFLLRGGSRFNEPQISMVRFGDFLWEVVDRRSAT